MVQITTHTLAVNAAFLQEIKEDHQELHRLFGETVVVLSGTPSPEEVAELMAQLHDQIQTHFRLEEAFGYFEDAVTEQPWLGERAAKLKAEHQPLSRDMEQLVQRSSNVHTAEALSPLLVDFQKFLDAFQTHEQAEIDLIMSAFTEDVGVAD